MFNKKTVFILGAGASWHYGYPTGEDLVRMVKEKAEDIAKQYRYPARDGLVPQAFPGTYPRNFKAAGFDSFIEQLGRIRDRISEANPLVIDDFFGRNKDISGIGKLLIAMVLIDCEKKHVVRSGKINKEYGLDTGMGDWARYIVQQLIVDCETPEKLLDNDVTLVTFNYDLSLELRLHQALKNYQYFAEGGIADKFFAKERFLHVYGQIYEFNPAHPGAPEGFYNNTEFPLAAEIDRAHDAAQHIRTISPGEKTATREIVDAIAEAEYVYFLGYGFDRRNNQLLQLGHRLESAPRQIVNFTNFGNSNKVSKCVERTFFQSSTSFGIDGGLLGDLVGNGYRKKTSPQAGGAQFFCEKSTKSVCDALAQDFDWPE